MKRVTDQHALRWILAIICIGASLVILGVLGGIGFQGLGYRAILNTQVISSNESQGYDTWVEDEFDDIKEGTKFEIFFWNLTNPAAVLKGGKPDFKEVGPYIHRNYDKAVDPVWNEDRSNVTYIQRIASFPNFTVGVDANMYTDKITLMNPYYLGAIKNIGSEQALLVKMTAPALLTIITNLQSTAFLSQVTTGTTATMLPLVKQNTVAVIGEANFLKIWANVSQSVNITGFPKGMRISSTFPSNITFNQAKALWTCTTPISFCNKTKNQGIYLWVGAAGNNSVAIQTIMAATHMSRLQVNMVASWLITYNNTVTVATLLTKYSITTLSDLGYIQWGSAAPLNGLSVSDATTTPGIPEFAIYCKRKLNSSITTTLNQTKSILAGPYAITTATNLGAFLTLYKTQNWAVIQQRYFIGQGIATALASYLSATTTNYVMPTLQTVFNQGGDLISTRTAEQWLWGKTYGEQYYDPFLSFLGAAAAKSFFFNDSTIDAARERNSTWVKLTGKHNISEAGQVVARNGQTYWNWAEPVKVSGSDGQRWRSRGDNPDTPVLWNEDLKRPLHIGLYNGRNYTTFKGLDCIRYYTIGEAREYNPLYFNYIPVCLIFFLVLSGQGIINISHIAAPGMFSSIPHLSGGGEQWLVNFTSDMVPDESNHRTTFDIHEFTGLAVRVVQQTQTNILLDNTLGAMVSAIHAKVQKNSMYPLFWMRKSTEANDKQANKLKIITNLDDAAIAFGLVVGLTGGFIMLVGFAFLALWFRKQHYWSAPARIESKEEHFARLQELGLVPRPKKEQAHTGIEMGTIYSHMKGDALD